LLCIFIIFEQEFVAVRIRRDYLIDLFFQFFYLLLNIRDDYLGNIDSLPCGYIISVMPAEGNR